MLRLPRTSNRSPIQGASLLGLAALLVLGLATACSDTPEPPADATPEAPAAESTPSSQPAGGGEADDFAPISSRTPSASEEGTPVLAAGLAFSFPAAWTPETPSSSMRAAQASIPGDGGPAQLTVFHFGAGGGGGVESNLQRWAGQVELAPGTTPIRDQVTTRHGLQVTWIDVQGTIKPSTMGVGPTEPQPGSRLLGAVLEGTGGPWFFKATGPADTLANARDAFLAMLQDAQLQAPPATGPVS